MCSRICDFIVDVSGGTVKEKIKTGSGCPDDEMGKTRICII
jgi:hypothetical protein